MHDVKFSRDRGQRDEWRENTMAVTRYQFRLSTYLLAVVIGALVAASPRLIEWMVRGRPREYVSVEIDGKMELFDARVWPSSSLNPKNQPSPLTYAAPIGEIGSTADRAAPGR
jgi:hypothetical protein